MRALVTTANAGIRRSVDMFATAGKDSMAILMSSTAVQEKPKPQVSFLYRNTTPPTHAHPLAYGFIAEGSKSNFYDSSRVKNRLLSLSFVRGSNLFFDYQIGQFIYQTFNLIICMAHLQIMQNMPRVHIKFLTGIHMNSNGTPIQSLLA